MSKNSAGIGNIDISDTLDKCTESQIYKWFAHANMGANSSAPTNPYGSKSTNRTQDCIYELPRFSLHVVGRSVWKCLE